MFENNSRVVIVEKSRSTWTGPCTITKSQAALRQMDGTVKKYVTRRWFTKNESDLTPSQANYCVTGDTSSPYYEEVIYLIISLRGNERQRFAGSDDELSEVMRVTTIETMRELSAGVEARNLFWVARTHPDYPNPCVKVLVNRDIGRGRSKSLKAFPRRLRTACSDAFLRVFDEAILRN
jgi:hypothetical protein